MSADRGGAGRAQNAFVGLSKKRDDRQLTDALGPARAIWDKLIGALKDECDGLEWNSYSPKAGWSLRLKHGQRNIVYLSPGQGCFLASFALGDRAVEAAREAGLPAKVRQIIKDARRYAEGTAVRIEVKSLADLPAVQKLVAIKLAH